MQSNLIKLTPEYLQKRYEFWKEQIGKNNIWNADKFKPVKLIIRKNHKDYNALFQRKFNKSNRTIEDKIIIYNKVEVFDKVYLDSLIVHEMIHQYLTQNKMDDQNPHGKPFIEMMSQINIHFPSKLNIQVRSDNPMIPLKGKGKILHYLLLILKKTQYFCCVIHPKRINEFNLKVKSLKNNGRIKDYLWAQSFDCYFNDFTRCMKVLAGEVMTLQEMKTFCKEYSITKMNLHIK
ncbi:MAG: SprT-like domain-containing protein [Muribaculaceae bacterium]|nr:SprT-like domain-containing protein [Muribaculaceae bacterium]